MSNTIDSLVTDGYELSSVDQDPVTNTGTILFGSSQNIAALQGDALTAWTVTNDGTIDGGANIGVDLEAGGSITNAAGALIAGYDGAVIQGAAGTLVNSGTIYAELNGAAVAMTHGGDVTNLAGGQINGGDGVLITTNAGTITNDGTIVADAEDAAVDLGAGGSVINQADGVLTGKWGISIQGSTTGSVSNSGVITGGSQSGVFLTGGTVINTASGQISGNWGVVFSGAAGTLTTAGVISNAGTGSNAVQFSGGFNNLLTVLPGASFYGGLEGGNATSASAVSTLELATDGVTTGVSTLNTSFADFGAIVFDAGASWSISSAATTFAGATISGFSAGDTIELAGITASLSSYQAGTLTLLSSKLGTITFNLVSTDPNSTINVSDGDAGTYITVGRRVMDWTPSSNTVLTENLNWTDATNASSPAFSMPGTLDSVNFVQGGGMLTGTLSVADAIFGGDAAWSLATGSTLNIAGTATDGTLTVGNTDAALLLVKSNATLIAAQATIGQDAGSDGSDVTVKGSGATWNVSGQLTVGDAAAGALMVAAGGTVTAGSIDTAAASNGDAIVSVVGTGSNITLSGDLTVGDAGSAELSILSGGIITAANANIGVLGTGTGNIDIEGAGSRLNITNDLNLGESGLGVLTVGQGATLTVTNNLNQGANSVMTIVGGVIDPASGTLSGTTTISANGAVQYTNLLTLNGTVSANGVGGTLEAAYITGHGVLSIGTNSNLVLQGGTGGNDGPIFTGTVTPSISFQDNTGTLTISDLSGIASTSVLNNFTAGDVIRLVGQSVGSTQVVNTNTLDVYNNNGDLLGALHFNAANVNSADLTAGIEGDSAPCFAEGTCILTARGEIPVESLTVGTLLPTVLQGGGMQPIKWIGVSTVRLDGHPNPDRAAPICVRSGALGDGMPRRDLRLSPEHSLLIDGVLVPVHLLVNGASIVREPAHGTVRYFHIELERHTVILADGALAETYLDTGNRDQFDNGGVTRQLHPGFDSSAQALEVWRNQAAAPILLGGDQLVAIHDALAARATELGYVTTQDPALTIEVENTSIPLRKIAPQTFSVSLPAGVDQLRLRSRSFVPSAFDRAVVDHRRLGVAVAEILLDGVPLPTAAFGRGFHPAEPGWRWTDGDAVVHCRAGGVLTVQLIDLGAKYWISADDLAATPQSDHDADAVLGKLQGLLANDKLRRVP